MCHYANDKRCADFNLKPKAFSGRAPLGPTGGVYSTPPDPELDLDRGKKDNGGRAQEKRGATGGGRERNGREGRRRERGESRPHGHF